MNLNELGWLCSWVACVICVFYTLRCAKVFAKHEPQVYLGLAIFAAQWATLIVYYSSHHRQAGGHLPEFLPAIAGYLCAISSCILYRHRLGATDESKGHITKREFITVLALYTVVIPHALPENIDHEDVEVGVTFVLKFVGFFSAYKFARASSPGQLVRYPLYFALAFYCLLELTYTIKWLWIKHAGPLNAVSMDTFFLWAFAGVKLAFTGFFVPVALSSCKDYKARSASDRLLAFFHIEGK